MQAADADHVAGDRGGRLGLRQVPDELGDVDGGDLPDLRHAAPGQEPDVPVQVAPVGRDGVGREPPFGPDVVEVVREGLGQGEGEPRPRQARLGLGEDDLPFELLLAFGDLRHLLQQRRRLAGVVRGGRHGRAPCEGPGPS